MKYVIQVVKKRKFWYWVLKHRNGNILAHSETYTSISMAQKTATRLFSAFKAGICEME